MIAPTKAHPEHAPTACLEAWLHEAGLGDHAAAFRAERIAPNQLSGLTDAELRELGLPLGDRIRFRLALARADPAPNPTGVVAERRPLTVAFFDLVDSTGLAERVEPEDLLDTLRRYHEACIGPILRYGGQVARFLGDGILAYFCYPVAHEDDPERAVRAALEALAAVSRVTASDGGPLAARAGIATGRVVLGALFHGPATAVGGEPNQALGTTLNLAARLQTLAPPAGVVIAAETAARLRGRFPLEDLGLHPLRGFAAPVRAIRALAEGPHRARSQRRSSPAAGFVGREAELALLHTRWTAALAGRGGAVVVRGEAGIGKSRLARRFVATRAARGASATFAVFASPFHGDDPLQPVAAALPGWARLGGAEASDALDRLRRRLLLDEAGAEDDARLAAVAELLGVAGEREAALLEGTTPARLRALTLDALVTSAARVAQMRPLLLLVEDAHWLDPTTLELVERVVAKAAVKRLLVLLTARDEFSLPAGEAWAGTAILELRGLQEAEAVRLFAALIGKAPPPQLGHDLAARTAGVPLFVEEFAHALRENSPCGAVSAAMPEIPATLHECLAARLDRAGSAKAVAQAAAVLGEDGVRAPLLAAVAELPEVAVAEALVRLEGAGVLERGHDPATEAWSFRHALLRETAYDSLLRDHRRALHGRAADALANTGEQAILAHHLSEAGRASESVPHFLAAARRSLARSALQEAMRLLRRGLEAVEALPESAEQHERRLELMALLGPALIGLNGPGSHEAQSLYADALALARTLPPRAEYFPIFWGWWRLSHVRDFHERRARATWLFSEAESRGDRGLLLQAHHCNWASLFHQGNLCGCDRHAEEGLAIYRKNEHSDHASLYGNHDAKVCGHAHRVLVFWQRGFSRAAEVEEARALAWARRLGHVGSVLHALEFATSHSAYRRNPEEVCAMTDRMCAVAEEHGFGEYRARCRVFHGWAMAMRGEARAGASLAAEGLAMERETNTADDLALFHCLVAEAQDRAGESERALAELAAARDEFERIGLRYWLPEVWRTIGDLTLRADPKAEAAAAAAYAEACRLAEEQGAHRLALRAALGAARLALFVGGERAAAAARLAAARARVTEVEAGAADLSDAGALAKIFGAPRQARPLLVAGKAVR
jgi:class 3 adenylate cyclase/predicted ATPase